MRGYSNKIINTTKYININIYFLDIIIDSKIYLTKISIKVYLINNLKVNILIRTDILTSYKFLIDYTS